MARDEDLLDIKQAASLLNVSEASLRRWTNAGRLSSFRVGGRRERRFRRADLMDLLDRRAAVDPAPGGPAAGGSRHLCGFYASAAVRARQAAGFLSEGLRARSACFLVSAPRVRDQVLALIGRDHVSRSKAPEPGGLVCAPYAGSAAAQIAFCEERFAAALDGADSVCAVGDVSSALFARRGSIDEVLDYEAEYERSISRRFPVTTLCLHDARTLSGVETCRLLRTHGDAFTYPVERLLG